MVVASCYDYMGADIETVIDNDTINADRRSNFYF